MLRRKNITKEQALQKAKHYCAYQERSHYEVKEKLYSFGLRKTEVEEILSQLIEENFLNEERFAKQFALGKFRMKQWGKIKIRNGLKQKQVSEYCIKKAMQEIDKDSYHDAMQKLAEQKWNSIKGAGVNRFAKMNKTTAYLLQKGYEYDIVKSVIQQLREK